MGFSSVDDFVNEVTTNGKFYRVDWFKNMNNPAIGTVVAGRWYDLTLQAGVPANWTHGNYVNNWDFVAGTNGWTLGDANWEWTAATHVVTRTAAGGGATLSQNTPCISGVTYRVTYVLTRSAGTITPSLGGTNLTARSAAGTFVEDISCGATASAPLVFTPDASFAGTVDKVVIQRLQAFTPYTSIGTAIGSELMLNDGGAVSPDTKHIVNMGVFGTATLTCPCVMMLVDMLGVYPLKNDTNTSQTLTQGTNFVANGDWAGGDVSWTYDATDWTYNANAMDKDADGVGTLYQTPAITPLQGLCYEVTFVISNYSVGGTMTVGFGGGTTTVSITGNGTYIATIEATGSGNLIFTPPNAGRFTIDNVTCYYGVPRYTSGDGVRAFYSIGVLSGAQASSQFTMSYTNTTGTKGAGTDGRTLGMTVVTTTSAIVSHIAHSGVGTGNTGPFLPLQATDTGIRKVTAARFSVAGATANGQANLVLCKPLASIPVTTAFVAAERDLMNQLPSLPRLRDGACLGILVFAGAVIPSASTYQGYHDVAWG